VSLRRVLLVGGGHAHLRMLRSLERRRPSAAARWTLVSPSPGAFYSGMVPGFLQGTYVRAQVEIDLAAACARADIDFVPASARVLDTRRRVIETDAGDIGFDYASLDVGSVPAGLDLPGVREHAFTLRPMRRAVELRARVDEMADRAQKTPVRLVVVGAGAAGFEVALALHRRLTRRSGPAAMAAEVVLAEAGDEPLPEYSRRLRRRAKRILDDRGIRLVTDSTVASVDGAGVWLASGARLEADTVVWTTGPAPPPVLGMSTLPLSERGYFHVDATLRAIDGAPVWGAGDCVDVGLLEVPKAGVYAVREGPILTHNLGAALGGGSPRRYEPQDSFLSLLNTADGQALLRWKGIVHHGRLAWRLKDWIDRRFVKG